MAGFSRIGALAAAASTEARLMRSEIARRVLAGGLVSTSAPSSPLVAALIGVRYCSQVVTRATRGAGRDLPTQLRQKIPRAARTGASRNFTHSAKRRRPAAAEISSR